MAKRYPKRKLSAEDISRALNSDLDSDDSNDRLENSLGEDSGSDIEFTLNRPRKSYISDSDSDSLSDSDNLNKGKRKKNCKYGLPSKFAKKSVHEGKKPFECEICDVQFVLKEKLNEHIASVHEGKKPFKCDKCESCFTLKKI